MLDLSYNRIEFSKGIELKFFLVCLKERAWLEELYLNDNKFESAYKNYERFFIAELLNNEFFCKLNDVILKNRTEDDGDL